MGKWIKRILIGLLLLVLLAMALLYITGNKYVIKGAMITYGTGHKTAFLSDYEYSENNSIDVGTPDPWAVHRDYNKVDATDSLMHWHKELGSVAFMIIKNDSIWHEKYYDGYGPGSKSNSFSMSKSMVSAMLGKAIMEGKIKGLDQKVSDFYPQYSEGHAADLTVGHLSSMVSGSDWIEKYYSPFSITAESYYTDDLADLMMTVDIEDAPGQGFIYSSGDTQLLGMIIKKAVGMSLSQYWSEKFWKPMGAEHQALWQVDGEEHRLEKAYCCLASNAKDFARLGKLYKDHGKWKGKTILDSTFVAKSVRPVYANSPVYGYGFWLHNIMGKDFFMMRGHLGQYVIVQPEENIIIVRLGHNKTPDEMDTDYLTGDITIYIKEAYKMLAKG